jgi:hypothetical protein
MRAAYGLHLLHLRRSEYRRRGLGLFHGLFRGPGQAGAACFASDRVIAHGPERLSR